MTFPTPKLLLIGDSIVNNMYANTTARAHITSGSGFAGPTLGGTITLFNQAVNGDIVQGQLTLWQASALRGDQSLGAVFVQCGVNNAKGGDHCDLVLEYMENLIEDIRSHNPITKILLSQIMPCGIYLDGLGANHRGNLEFINALFKERYGANPRIHDMFQDPRSPGNLWTEFDSGDGLHPSSQGYLALAKQIRIWMDQQFPDSASNAYARMTDGQLPATMRIIDLASTRLAASAYTTPDNASVVAIKTKTDNLPTTPAAQSDVTTVGTAVAAVSTKLGTPVGASVSLDIAAVKAKTDNLPSNPAAQTNLDVPVSTRAPSTSAVSNVDLTPVRIAKLDQLDVAISTRNSVVPNNAGIAAASAAATAAAAAASAAASSADAAFSMASYALSALLGLHLVQMVTYVDGSRDIGQVVYRLYDSDVNARENDGVTGLVRQATRQLSYGASLAGAAHQLGLVLGS